MNKRVLEVWEKNQDVVRNELEKRYKKDTSKNIFDYNYKHLVEFLFEYGLNDLIETKHDIVEYQTGAYEGTYYFTLILNNNPKNLKIFTSYVHYGSCSYCDALTGAYCVSDYMRIMLTIVQKSQYLTINLEKIKEG